MPYRLMKIGGIPNEFLLEDYRYRLASKGYPNRNVRIKEKVIVEIETLNTPWASILRTWKGTSYRSPSMISWYVHRNATTRISERYQNISVTDWKIAGRGGALVSVILQADEIFIDDSLNPDDDVY